MTLKEIFNKMQEYVEANPIVLRCDDSKEYEKASEGYDELQDSIFADNQTYFMWEVDNDTFEIDTAFKTVLYHLQGNNKLIKNSYVDYLQDDLLIVLIETETIE